MIKTIIIISAILLLFLTAFVVPEPPTCSGPSVRVNLDSGYFAASVNWAGSIGSLCLVELTTSNNIYTIYQDIHKPYTVLGFGTPTVIIADCYDCLYADIFYNEYKALYLPFIGVNR